MQEDKSGIARGCGFRCDSTVQLCTFPFAELVDIAQEIERLEEGSRNVWSGELEPVSTACLSNEKFHGQGTGG